MKKLLLLCLVASSFCDAKAQVPNPGFEIPNDSNDGPNKWRPFSPFAFPLDPNCTWTGIDSLNFWSTDAHSGARAYELRVATYCTSGYGGSLNTRMYKPDTFADHRIPFAGGSPTAFTFYYKFEPIGGDMVSPTVELELEDGTQVAGGAITLTQPTSGWTLATIPVTYFENAIPEFLNIAFRMHNTGTTNLNYGSRFVVDDINTIFPASVGETAKSGLVLQCYPVPAKDILNITLPKPTVQSGELIVVDALGRNVMQQDIPANQTSYQISINNLPPGFYSLKLSNATDIFTGRFVK